MALKKIVIIGGGFSGLSALAKLSAKPNNFSITLIDRKVTFDFLPALPDALSRGVAPDHLTVSLKKLVGKYRAEFICSEVKKVDFSQSQVYHSFGRLTYDYLIIASGSETNFYHNQLIAENSLKLDRADQIKEILAAIADPGVDNLVIAGAGYTGIEIATHLARLIRKRKSSKKVIIIEKAKTILGPLPKWMKSYVDSNLKQLKIELRVDCGFKEFRQDSIVLSDGSIITKAKLIWTAGVRMSDFIFDLKIKKNQQGRIKVNSNLAVNNSCFVVGDSADFSDDSGSLRMGVQFAVAQGALAARNIILSSQGRPLVDYKPKDLGYIIPLANNHSCGKVLGVNLTGFIATFLHYFMCIYRIPGLLNKRLLFWDLLRGGR